VLWVLNLAAILAVAIVPAAVGFFVMDRKSRRHHEGMLRLYRGEEY
jgi:hypothetical protein